MNPENEAAPRAPGEPSTVRARKLELARRRRRIRNRVSASAAGLFAGTWLFIAVQLISGHDPALAKTSSNGTATTSAVTATSSSPSTTTTSTPAITSTSSPSSNSSSASGSSVTTRQS